MLVYRLGSLEALAEAAWGALASAMLAAAIDLAARMGWLVSGRLKPTPAGAGGQFPSGRSLTPASAGVRLLAGIAAVGLLLLPGPLMLFERLALRPEPEERTTRPSLTLLTGLPILWSEDGVAETLQGKPGASRFHEIVQRSYALRPIDVATAESLAGARLLLVAQPRPPGPAGLVAIDRWVRQGGKALILSDPALRWPSELPLGDPRRPPPDDGLGPLLLHWGLRLEPSPQAGLVNRDVQGRRLILAAPGRLVRVREGCTLSQGGLLADCALGTGRAILFADADLLHDLLWAGPGDIGTSRAGRLADNADFVTDLMDRLNGGAGSGTNQVVWISRSGDVGNAAISALLLALLPFLAGVWLICANRRGRHEKDSDKLIHRRETGT